METAPSTRTPANWFTYAERDLASARSLRRYDGPSPRHAGWLAEQAAEKALLAAVTAVGIQPPDTHDLDTLRRLLPADWQIHQRFPDLSGLSAWFPLAVYPGEWAVVLDDGASDTVDLGEAVVACLREDLAAHRFELDAH